MPVHVSTNTGAIVYSAPDTATTDQVLVAVDAYDRVSWEDLSSLGYTSPITYVYTYNANRQLWTRPTNHKMMRIYCLGSGAGGGNGASSALYAGGGGGGGSGAAVSWEGPALWTSLWAFVATGGAAVNPGALSYVSTYDTATTADLLVISGAVVPEHGGNGAGPAGGIAGTSGTVSLPTGLSMLGASTCYAGVLGAAGGDYNIVGYSLVALAGGPTTGGAGGGGHYNSSGGLQYKGGDITGAGSLISATIAGGPAGGGDGGSGYSTLLDGVTPLSTGGSGGGGYAGGAGAGKGGDGGYGSGGGGGGAGGAAPGAGGAGGNGIVVIMSW